MTGTVNPGYDAGMRPASRVKFLFGSVLFGIAQLINWWIIQSAGAAVYVNREAVFGSVRDPRLIALGVILAIGLVVKLIQSGLGAVGQWGLLFLSIGGFSNLLDRFVYGGVVDYLRLGTLSTFNLADSLIVLGAIMVALERPSRHPLPLPRKMAKPASADLNDLGPLFRALRSLDPSRPEKTTPPSPVHAQKSAE